MSLLRTLDRTSAVSNTTHAHPCLAFLYPASYTKTPKRAISQSAVSQTPRPKSSAAYTENFFIQALVRAGSCSKHAQPISTRHDSVSTLSSHHKLRQQSTWHAPENPQRSNKKGPLKKVRSFAEKELRALVDYYGMEIDTRPEDDVKDDGNLVWNVGDTHEPWPLREESDAVHIKQLEKLLEDEEASHELLFEAYKKLHSPGVVYLTLNTIRLLLHQLSIVERPSPIAMQRFLSILDDMKTAHIHISQSEWTSAIHLTGHATGKVSADDLHTALNIWRDMEQRAGVRGGYVTFNVLFNVAVKAGKFTLAETFVKEMQTRKLPMHRHYRISLLYYYGVLQNGKAVRKTFQDLVSAGDIVDTVVLNAVIAALIRAGEPSAGEQVFERMKRLHATKAPAAPGHTFFNRTWRDRRYLALLLTHEARRLNQEGKEEELKRLQEYAPIAPNSRTYSILIRYHASTAGNIDRVNELLKEMKYNSVPLEGTIFIVIFHGFNSFSGVRYTSWTPYKLDKIWTQYLTTLKKNDHERMWLSSLAVVAALKAFQKCTDSERTLRAWDEIKQIWNPDEQELESVMKALRKLVGGQLGESVQQRGFFDARAPS